MPKQKRALSSSQPPVLASTELKLHSRYFPYGKSVLSPDSRTSETLSRSREVAREGRDAVVTGQAVGKSVAPSKRPENQAESMLAQIVVVPAKRKAPKQRRKPAMTSMIPDKTLRLVLREPHCDRSVKMPFRLLAVRPRLLQSTDLLALELRDLPHSTTFSARLPIPHPMVASHCCHLTQ